MIRKTMINKKHLRNFLVFAGSMQIGSWLINLIGLLGFDLRLVYGTFIGGILLLLYYKLPDSE